MRLAVKKENASKRVKEELHGYGRQRLGADDRKIGLEAM